MKTLIILVCVVVAHVQAAEFLRQMLGDAITECKDKTKATSDDISQLLQHHPLTTTAAKCLVACLNKKLKIQTAAGEIDAEAVKGIVKLTKSISEDIYQKAVDIVDKCLAQVHTGDTECDVAYNFFICNVDKVTAAKLPMLFEEFS